MSPIADDNSWPHSRGERWAKRIGQVSENEAWMIGWLDDWMIGSFDHLITWSFDHLIIGSLNHLIIGSLDHWIIEQMLDQEKFILEAMDKVW